MPDDMPCGEPLVVLFAHDDLVAVSRVFWQLEAAAEADRGRPRARMLLHPIAGHGASWSTCPFRCQ
jgi:hypothetical protein